jgi:hypothetical protein
MVNDFQRRRNCYHEAGHAVAWVINGDAVLKVVGDAAGFTEGQEELWKQIREAHAIIGDETTQQGRECTVAQVNDHPCPCCNGAIKADPRNRLAVEFHLSAECLGCMKLLTNHLACIFAGGSATSSLEHGASLLDRVNNACKTTRERRHDCREVDRILTGLVEDEQQRNNIRQDAERLAEDRVKQEWKAVTALAAALFQQGELDGSKAEHLIRDNLYATKSG